jgi:hypothetical protein
MNVGVRVSAYRILEGKVSSPGFKSQPEESARDSTGYVVPLAMAQSANDDLFARLHATGKPVVIIDEIGGWELPRFAAHSGRFLVIDARNYERAGRKVASALAALGHRHCAYFSAFHSDLWSHSCLHGIQAVYAVAGPKFRISSFVTEGSDISSTPESKLLVQKYFEKLRAGYEKERVLLPATFTRQLDPYFEHLLGQQIVFAWVRSRLEPLFRRAMSDKSISCWIVSNREAAWFSTDFLSMRSVRPSVVGFGWSPEITHRRIAAFDFNIPAAARATTEFLLHPRRRLPGQRGFKLGIEGTLINRESLRLAN